MTEAHKLASPMMRTTTRLHSHCAARQSGEEVWKLIAPQLPPKHNSSNAVRTVQLKDMLRDIQSDRGNLTHGRLLEWLATPPLWHTDAVGGVHPINLGSHKGKAVRQAIKKAGARLLFLPPYSPDFNPIEQAFAKIKHWMRCAHKRTFEYACAAIGSLDATIAPSECKNYFADGGYASVKAWNALAASSPGCAALE
jgi:hypothetical protein